MKVKDLINLTAVVADYKNIIERIGDKDARSLSTSELTLLRRVSTGSISAAKAAGKDNEEIILMDKFATGTRSGCGKDYGVDDTLMARTVELAKLFGTINIKQGWNDWAKANHPDHGGDNQEFARVKALYENWVKLAARGI